MNNTFKIGFCLWELMDNNFTALFNMDKAFKKEDLLSHLHEYCNKFIDEVMKIFDDNDEDKDKEHEGIGSLF